MVKLPASLVLADAATPVFSLTARTSAPGTAAPLESLTRPRMVPRGSCAKQGDRNAAARTRADGKLLGTNDMRNSSFLCRALYLESPKMGIGQTATRRRAGHRIRCPGCRPAVIWGVPVAMPGRGHGAR